MRTAYCPKSHNELAKESAGVAYGHVPGHQYHDVDVVISERDGKFRCHVVESWGSAQGYDEEHGRREAIGRGDSISQAVEDARSRAKDAGIECEYLEQALSKAEDAAIETFAEETVNSIDVIQTAVEQLSKSSRGREAMEALLPWLTRHGVGLDTHNQAAVANLLEHFWNGKSGTVADAMRTAIRENPAY